jgi:hypothetical protein
MVGKRTGLHIFGIARQAGGTCLVPKGQRSRGIDIGFTFISPTIWMRVRKPPITWSLTLPDFQPESRLLQIDANRRSSCFTILPTVAFGSFCTLLAFVRLLSLPVLPLEGETLPPRWYRVQSLRPAPAPNTPLPLEAGSHWTHPILFPHIGASRPTASAPPSSKTRCVRTRMKHAGNPAI